MVIGIFAKNIPMTIVAFPQKINFPNEANDTYAVGTKNTMSFVSESGDPLGYITYEYVSDVLHLSGNNNV